MAQTPDHTIRTERARRIADALCAVETARTLAALRMAQTSARYGR